MVIRTLEVSRKHCEEALKKVGFKPAPDPWKSVFWNKDLKVLLTVYVDDFKMAGPRCSV